MKRIFLLLVVILAVQQSPAQIANDIHGSAVQDSDVSYAPLLLFTDGEGCIFPFDDGQILRVGRRYHMVAIPERGFKFSSWQPVNVFTFTEITRGPDSSFNPPIESSVASPVPEYFGRPELEFTMQPVTVIFDDPGVRSVTESSGWQANFVPVEKPIHRMYHK